MSKVLAEGETVFSKERNDLGSAVAFGERRAVLWGLRTLVAGLLCFKLFLIYRINVNWDEFVYLAHVMRFQEGGHLPLIQSFYVHPFAWLAWVPGFEMEKIQAARLAVAVLGMATAGLIYAIARRYLSELAALGALLLYLSDPVLLKHGYSFRADPLCGFLFLVAVYGYLLAERHRLAAALGGASLAVSALISIKAVFFGLPLALLFGAFLWRDGRRALGPIGIFSIAFVLTFASLLTWHSSMLNGAVAGASTASVGSTVSGLERIAQKVLLQTGFFPRWREFLLVFSVNPVLWFTLFGGVVLAARQLWRKGFGEVEVVVIAACSLLLPLLIYRNAFSYFYVFLLPLPIIAVGYSLDRLFKASQAPEAGTLHGRSRGSILRTAVLICVVVLPIWSFAQAAVRQAADNQRGQREILELIHRVFPQPVPYIDRNSMVATFPKVGFFMSTWGVEGYRTKGLPVFRKVLLEEAPRFLIANTPLLHIDDPAWFGEDDSVYRLLDEDYQVLHDNFVPFWGALYVLGKRFEDLDAAPLAFEILVPGKYELLSENPVMIDGLPLLPGEALTLSVGEHAIRMPSGQGDVMLREAELPDAPTAEPNEQPIYDGL